MTKVQCPLKNCRYFTTSEHKIRTHIVKHNPELIYDFAFDNGLLPGSENNDTFHFVVNEIMRLCK